MKKRKEFDFFGILVGVIIGVLIGYLIATKIELPTDKTDDVLNEEEIEYVYLLQVAKFDNPTGANNYYNSLKGKDLETVIVYDKIYYYIYAGIGISEESLASLANKYYMQGYSTIIKRELLIDKANSIIDEDNLYSFYSECIHNLYLSLKGNQITISEKYYVNPINIELFSQFTILMTLKNDELKQKASLQAYKIIIEDLS